MSLTVGDKFRSFALWEEAVKKYELENYVQLWRRDARTIQAAKKRLTSTTDRQFNEDLQYNELKYCCIKGEGSILQEQLEAVPTHQLFEVNAAFKSGLKVTKDGQYLEIVTMNKDHNHDINSASFNLHPARRILANEEKQQAS